jgi:NTP pyrophosphatase (non-canonical NTP hydrolase)
MSREVLTALRQRLEEFAKARDWDQFHSPKNLSMALSVEVAELVEHFQWLTEAESASLSPEVSAQVAQEIADIQIYLVRLADKLGVDIESAVTAKLEVNERKYPIDQARGSAAKYTHYKTDADK